MTLKKKRSNKANNYKKDVASVNAAGTLFASGIKQAIIAERLKVSMSTVKRWIKEFNEVNKGSATSIEKDETAIYYEKLIKKARKVIEECLDATRPYGKDAMPFPDYGVRRSTALDILHNQGELITKEDKSINIVNVVNIEAKRQENLKTGLNRFGFEILKMSDN